MRSMRALPLVLIATVTAALVALPGVAAAAPKLAPDGKPYGIPKGGPLAWTNDSPGVRARTAFTDPTGDTCCAPDFASVNVSDDQPGVITVSFATPNRTDFTAGDLVNVNFDTDGNPATGDPDGVEAAVYFNGTDHTYGFMRWNGTRWAGATATSMTASVSSGARVSVRSSELGVVSGFQVWLAGYRDADGTRHSDFAPDAGSWQFTLSPHAPPASAGAGASGAGSAGGAAGAAGAALAIPRMTPAEAKRLAREATRRTAKARKWGRTTCARQAPARFRCRMTFQNRRFAWKGLLTVSYWSDARGVYWSHAFKGERATQRCTRKARKPKARLRCYRPTRW